MRIKFFFQIGDGYLGYIAIDNLNYIEMDIDASTITPILETNIDCDFDSPKMCVWKNEDDTLLKWALNKGPTSTILTGPSVDHTTGIFLIVFIAS